MSEPTLVRIDSEPYQVARGDDRTKPTAYEVVVVGTTIGVMRDVSAPAERVTSTGRTLRTSAHGFDHLWVAEPVGDWMEPGRVGRYATRAEAVDDLLIAWTDSLL